MPMSKDNESMVKDGVGCPDKSVLLDPPESYVIELTNHCNIRCRMCNFHSPIVSQRRPKGFMELSLVERLLREISGAGRERPWVALHGAGESLLHKDFVTILRKASLLPNLNFGFLTNTMLLNAGMTEKILDTALSWIGFSIDGNDREKFEKYRCGADFEAVMKNAVGFIARARKSRPDIRIMVNMTMQDEMKNDVPEFVKFWIDKADEVSISPFRPVGSRDNELARTLPAVSRTPCHFLSTMMVVYWNGDVGLCCEDWFNDGKMGNLKSEGIEEVWNGRRFAGCRALHEQGRFDEVPLCRDCNSWHKPDPVVSFDNTLNCSFRKSVWQSLYFREQPQP
jgi:radical SAM protein with 4Fe4S-binding SPASM domain